MTEYIGRVVLDEMPPNPRIEYDCVGIIAVFDDSKFNFGDESYEAGILEWASDLIDPYRTEFEELIAGAITKDAVFGALVGDNVDLMWQLVEEMLGRKYLFLRVRFGYYNDCILVANHGQLNVLDDDASAYIYMTRERAMQEWPTEDYEERAVNYLIGEVESYNQYLNGEVYGWIIEKKCSCCGSSVVEESSFGYFGEEHAQESMEETLAYLNKKEEAETAT